MRTAVADADRDRGCGLRSGVRAAATDGYTPVPVDACSVHVELRLFGPFRDDTGVESVTLETDAGTYRDLLREVEGRYPALSGRLLDAEGEGLAGEVVVTRDGKNVRHLDGLSTPVTDGDVVRMIPSVYGGS